MRDDDLIDIGLCEFLRLDLVFLARAEEVVEEGDIEFEDLDEFYQAPVRDIEFAIEGEGARTRVRDVEGDLPIVDMVSQLSRVRIVLGLRLEGPEREPIPFTDQHPTDPDMVDDLGPVSIVMEHEFIVDMAT